VHAEQDLERLAEVQQRRARRRQVRVRRDAHARPVRLQLRLVEVGLQARLEDVEGRRQRRCGHASDAVWCQSRIQQGARAAVEAGEQGGPGAEHAETGKTYPPATKCAHDLATGAGFEAIAFVIRV